MEQLLQVRYSEIYLKGQNRPFFIRKLVSRVKNSVSDLSANVYLNDSRIYVEGDFDVDIALKHITKVFGVHSVSVSIKVEKNDFDKIIETAIQLMHDKTGTFKVVSRRSDKKYPMDSPTLSKELGAGILRKLPHLIVDVHNPDTILSIEIRDQAYLYTNPIPAVGGMPVGTNGRATLMLSGGIDSPVAGWMIAKRGVEINAVHFLSPPYTSERAKEKVVELAKIISESLCGVKLYLVPFTDIQMQIHEKCHPEYTTIIMRRYMMRIANAIANKENSLALITGESVGQVASQTLQAINCTNSVADIPVLRPLVGFDKQEIIEIANKIGTFETSTLPYEDCCTVFTPRHPAIKPKMNIILNGEENLETKKLVDIAVDNVEILYL